MVKKRVKIDEYWITQLNKNVFEIENPKQQLDFYLNAENSKDIEVIIFDSLISNVEKAYLGVFFSGNLENAVKDAMQLTKDNVKDIVMWL